VSYAEKHRKDVAAKVVANVQVDIDHLDDAQVLRLAQCYFTGPQARFWGRSRSAAAAAGADVTWLETPLDAEFTLIRQRRADAGLGWLTSDGADLPDPLDVMSFGEFEPEVWIPSSAGIGRSGTITLDELA
jgi:hypothetical protein